MTAAGLRDRAREAMLAAGGRGFVRFLPPGGALLVTDAPRRCGDEAAYARLEEAMEGAGFACTACGGLMELTPRDELLRALTAQPPVIDWTSPMHPVQALACRFLAADRAPLSPAGRQLILEALRLCWQPREKVWAGLDALRAQAAAMLRAGDRSGLHETGAVLAAFCEQEGRA